MTDPMKNNVGIPPLQWMRTPVAPPPKKPVPKDHSYINSASISADGSRIVAGNYFYNYDDPKAPKSIDANFGTYCYDRNGNLLWRHVPDQATWGGVYWTCVSEDGKYAASGGWWAEDPPSSTAPGSKYEDHTGFVQAFDAATGELLLEPYKTKNRVNMLGLSGDGSVLVAGSDDVLLFQLINGAYGPPAAYKLEHSAPVVSVAKDGLSFIVADYNGDVFLFDNIDGRIELRGQWSSPVDGPFHSIQISDDGKWFVVGGNDNDKYVYMFSREKMTNEQTYNWRYELEVGGRAPDKKYGLVYGVAITPDGRYVSVVGDGTPGNPGNGELYVLENGVDSFTFLWQASVLRNVNSTSMDAEGKYVTVSDGHPDGTPGHFYLFERATGKLLWRYETDNMSWPMFISKDGSGIVAGSDNGNVYYFEPEGDARRGH